MSPSPVEKKEVKSVIFYVCHSNWKLKTKPNTWSVCIPVCDKVQDPVTRKPVYDPLQVKTIVFKSWVYETNDPLEIEFLRIYNSWWVLKWKDWEERRIQSNTVTLVVEEKDFIKEQVREIETVKEVVKQVIPEFILNDMNIAWLKRFAIDNDCSEAAKDWLKKEQIIKVLKDKWFVQESKS